MHPGREVFQKSPADKLELLCLCAQGVGGVDDAAGVRCAHFSFCCVGDPGPLQRQSAAQGLGNAQSTIRGAFGKAVGTVKARLFLMGPCLCAVGCRMCCGLCPLCFGSSGGGPVKTKQQTRGKRPALPVES